MTDWEGMFKLSEQHNDELLKDLEQMENRVKDLVDRLHETEEKLKSAERQRDYWAVRALDAKREVTNEVRDEVLNDALFTKLAAMQTLLDAKDELLAEKDKQIRALKVQTSFHTNPEDSYREGFTRHTGT